MADIFDYLAWRGDLSFTVSEFNEVDNYICAKAGSPDFTGIVPENGACITVGEAMACYSARYGEAGERLGLLASHGIVPMLRLLPQTERYRGVCLSFWRSICDTERGEQFSAVTLLLPDGTAYIAFRGTDDTLLSWKEDCLLSVTDEVPAQADALRYLCEAAELFSCPLRVGGHSKGGNLAVYAAIHAPVEVQERILGIYNNDGPGFRTSVVGTEEYERIKPRLHTFLPQNSMVGMLLERTEDPVIVRCDRVGIEAHDGLTWEVMGTKFVRCGELSRSARAFGDAMEQMMQQMDTDERSAFIEELFELLGSTGSQTLTELAGQGFSRTLALLRDSRHSPEVKRFIRESVELIAREYAEEVRIAAGQRRASRAERPRIRRGQ